MIVRQFYMRRADGVDLYITYSDAGYKIQQSPTGAIYDSAVDVDNAAYTYTETNEPVDEPVDPSPPPSPTEPVTVEGVLNDGLVTLPSPDPEPDYLNENEPEPDYFGGAE